MEFFRPHYPEPMVKGFAQGHSRGSLVILGFELKTFQALDLISNCGYVIDHFVDSRHLMIKLP